MEGWIKVAEYARDSDSEVAESMLRAASIPYHFQGEHALSTVYAIQTSSARTLWVPPDRAEEALNILTTEFVIEETEE